MAVHRPTALIDPDGRRLEPASLAGRTFLAFCGLGNPEGFFRTLGTLGARLPGQECLEDHCQYSDATLARLSRRARELGCSQLITTQKDRVKIDPAKLPLPLFQLAVEMDVVDGRDELLQKIIRAANSTGEL